MSGRRVYPEARRNRDDDRPGSATCYAGGMSRLPLPSTITRFADARPGIVGLAGAYYTASRLPCHTKDASQLPYELRSSTWNRMIRPEMPEPPKKSISSDTTRLTRRLEPWRASEVRGAKSAPYLLQHLASARSRSRGTELAVPGRNRCPARRPQYALAAGRGQVVYLAMAAKRRDEVAKSMMETQCTAE